MVITGQGESCGSNECLDTVWKQTWLVCTFPALHNMDWAEFIVSLMPVLAPTYLDDLDCKEGYEVLISSSCPSWVVFEKMVSRRLLLLCTVRESIGSSHILLPAYLLLLSIACFTTRAACWVIKTAICPWRLGQVPEEVGWNHDRKRRLWPGVCWYTLCFLSSVSAHVSLVSFVLCPCTHWLSQLWRSSASPSVWILFHFSLYRMWRYPSSHTSQCWETFQKQHTSEMGGEWEGREKGGLFKLSPHKDLLLLFVVNTDLTYFCYNSIWSLLSSSCGSSGLQLPLRLILLCISFIVCIVSTLT